MTPASENLGSQRAPVFSVIVPAYNKGELLKNTLKSALRQTFTDYEIVVIDDGSTDNTAEVVSSFKDPRIRYYFQSNSGLPASARNAGIRRSQGSYIAFLDADDIWHPDKLTRCREVFLRDSGIDVVYHDEVMKDISGNVIRRLDYGECVPEMFRRLLFKGNCLSPSATIVRKEALVSVGLFRELPEFFSVEDYDLWLRLSKKHRLFHMSEVLGEYLSYDGNISAKIETHYNNVIAAIKKNYSEYADKRILDPLRLNIRISRSYFVIARHYVGNKDTHKAMDYLFKAIKRLFKYEHI